LVEGQGQAGLFVSAEECVFDTKAGPNSCKSEPTLNSTDANPQISKSILEFKNLVYIRYNDHAHFHQSSAMIMAPIVREAVGWLVYECDQYITLVFDRDARPPTLKGTVDPKASGLVLLRSDLVEFKKLDDFLPLIGVEHNLNSQSAYKNDREYAHLAKGSEKLPKKSRKGSKELD
jgi:hypothetical protein